MGKVRSSRVKIFIIIIIVISSTYIIKKLIVDPQPVRDIKKNTVYIGGRRGVFPKSDYSRYYIEFKDDNTYVLMHDDSRRKDEDYFEDGYWSSPEIEMFFGSYELRNGNYVLTLTERTGVEFKDVKAVKNKKINFFYRNKYKDGGNMEAMVFLTRKGNYLFGYPDDTGKSYDERARYYWLYNKSDIKKLPSNPEEFRKQFKMDKKAEQERLAKQERLAE